jgi:hypothetical protein
LGLKNVTERLARFYRGEAELVLTKREDGEGACARVILPLLQDEKHRSGLVEQARQKLRKVVR